MTNLPKLSTVTGNKRNSKIDGSTECQNNEGKCVRKVQCNEKDVLKMFGCGGKKVCCRQGKLQACFASDGFCRFISFHPFLMFWGFLLWKFAFFRDTIKQIVYPRLSNRPRDRYATICLRRALPTVACFVTSHAYFSQ